MSPSVHSTAENLPSFKHDITFTYLEDVGKECHGLKIKFNYNNDRQATCVTEMQFKETISKLQVSGY